MGGGGGEEEKETKRETFFLYEDLTQGCILTFDPLWENPVVYGGSGCMEGVVYGGSGCMEGGGVVYGGSGYIFAVYPL